MNGELGGGEETRPCCGARGDRDRQLAGGAAHASGNTSTTAVDGGTAKEDWTLEGTGANGREDSSLSSEEEDVEGRTGSGYMLLPQDPEVMNGDDVDEGQASPDTHEQEEPQTHGADSLPPEPAAVGESPRLTRWMERQIRDLTVSSSNHNQGGGGGGGVSSSGSDRNDSWAQFSEVAPSTGSENWPQISHPSTASSAVATGPVQPSSTMEKGIPYFL